MINSNNQKPVILVIAGHDPSGGAGIQADIESIANAGCHATTVITSLTAQNTNQVIDVLPQEPESFRKQIRLILEDMEISACKIGMIGNVGLIDVIQNELSRIKCPIVLDPVISATSGQSFADENIYKRILSSLLPLTTLITPNSEEARMLSQSTDLNDAANKLLDHGAKAVLITGTDEDTDDVFKMTSTCPDCDYVEVSEIPRTANKKEKHDPEYEKDRARFCSEEEGRKYAEAMNNMKELGKLIKEVEEREENKDVYDEVEKIKKLTVIELEELLAPVFEKQGYTKLQFGTPDMSKDLFLPFTTYDTKSERRDRESSYELQKIAREALEGTNWRLMSDGISYRSGILTGRFRAYEREEDLLKLVKQIKVK